MPKLSVTGLALTALQVQAQLSHGSKPHAVTVPPSAKCQKVMDDYCTADIRCKQALGAKKCNVDALYARHDIGLKGPDDVEWRCYSSSALTPDLKNYSSGGCYCTQDAELKQELATCNSGDDSLVDVFISGTEGYACYRIPSMVHVDSTVLVFAEGRKYSCAGRQIRTVLYCTVGIVVGAWCLVLVGVG